MMRQKILALLAILLAGSLVAGLYLVDAQPSLAQERAPNDRVPNTPSEQTPIQQASPDLAAWTYGPVTPFEFTRFDGAFVPGPDGEPWANKVYFLGGRNGTLEDPTIWRFDPLAGTYTDTGADVVEDVSNYNANLVMDDGTGRGPALYIIGGYNADGGAINIGTVQRYYPMSNVAEALPAADDWTVTVAGNLVTAMGNAVVNNVIYVFGGWENLAAPYFYDGTWAFDPTAPSGSRWTDLGVTLNPARSYLQVAVKDNLIYAMGGIYQYDGSDLVPTTVVEVFDPATPGAGWTAVAPMPVASGEGRGFGLDSDTLGTNSPWGGKIYLAGGGDWSANTAEVMEYDTGLDYWNQAFPDLNTARRDHAGVFVPLCTADPSDGLPGLWVFGGNAGSDTPPYAPTEYYPLECPLVCNVLVVDDDWDFDDVVPNDGGQPYYTSALDLLGYAYDVWSTVDSGDPTLADMQGYAAVVWFTGYAWEDVVNPANETEMAAYLDGGGNLLLSAQEYHYEAGVTPFMSNYLGVDTISDDVIEFDPIGIAGNPVGDGLGPYTMVRPDDWAAYWPTEGYEGPYDDYVYAALGSEEPFMFDTSGQPNSTNYDSGTFKTVYLGWPFEWIDTVEERADILSNALNWFCGEGPSEMELVPPAQSGSAPLGDVIHYTLTIINDLGYDETFDITYDSLWGISSPATVFVADGDMQDFLVDVTVPTEGNCGDADTATITATGQTDTLIFDSAFLNSSVSPAGVGDVTGVVVDANTSLGIPDALVDIYLGDLYYYDTHTDADGNFIFPSVPACTFTGDAYAFGYANNMDWLVTVPPASSIAVTVTMDASLPSLTPDVVTIETVPDTIKETSLMLENQGTGELNYYITELISGTIFPIPEGQALLPAGVDPLVYEQISASPEGQTRFIAYLAEEADLSRAFSISDRSERGWYVLNALRATAERSQAALRQELDKAGIAYESHYLVNALVLKGSTELVNMLSMHPDVAYIAADVAIPAPAPVEVLPTIDAPEAIEWNISLIGADDVWTTHGVTGEGMIISNIDTGVQWDHPALVNQYRGGIAGDHNYNWWDPYNQSPLVPNDTYGHGTHTMGTMLGSDDPTDPVNATNAIGVAPGAQWFACDGFDDTTQVGYTVELLECAEFILAPWDLTGANPDPDMRPDMVNNSWGGGQAQWWYNQAIYAWKAAGIFPVFSAGNAGPACETAGDPGDMANIMSVGATDINDVIAGFSSRGPAAITGITKPNVSAPGVNIRSAVPGSAYQGGWNGTSMAAPHVAGTAALIWAAVPELRGDVEVTYWLLEHSALGLTTTQGCGGDLPDEIPNNVYGWGRINALDAVELAMTQWDAPWMTVDPFMGTVAPAATQEIVLTFDSTGMEVGTCSYANLLFDYNDPYIIEEIVPVEMCVVEPSYAVQLSADMAGSGLPGETVTYILTVTNLGNVPDTFDLALGSFVFPSSLSTDVIGPLDAGTSATFEVVVEIPADASPGDFDAVTVTATSQTDTAATDDAVLTTTVEELPLTYTFLPVVYK